MAAAGTLAEPAHPGHLAYASLPLREEEQALRLVMADERIEAGPRWRS